MRHQNSTGDETSSHTSESSDTVFPELQQLPKEAKLPIRVFLREQSLSFKGREDIPRKIRLLAEATEEVEGEDEDHETEGAGGPYGTILHTAAAVGNYWLVELQIKAGVDVSAVDNHFWTALMVATAQGHAICTKLLSEHMESRKLIAAPQPLRPSGLVKAEPRTSILLGPNNLTAATGSWGSRGLQKRIQLRSDHPIPPEFRTFYYEMEILTNGPLGYVYTSAIKLLYTNSSFLVSSALAYANQ